MFLYKFSCSPSLVLHQFFPLSITLPILLSMVNSFSTSQVSHGLSHVFPPLFFPFLHLVFSLSSLPLSHNLSVHLRTHLSQLSLNSQSLSLSLPLLPLSPLNCFQWHIHIHTHTYTNNGQWNLGAYNMCCYMPWSHQLGLYKCCLLVLNCWSLGPNHPQT